MKANSVKILWVFLAGLLLAAIVRPGRAAPDMTPRVILHPVEIGENAEENMSGDEARRFSAQLSQSVRSMLETAGFRAKTPLVKVAPLPPEGPAKATPESLAPDPASDPASDTASDPAPDPAPDPASDLPLVEAGPGEQAHEPLTEARESSIAPEPGEAGVTPLPFAEDSAGKEVPAETKAPAVKAQPDKTVLAETLLKGEAETPLADGIMLQAAPASSLETEAQEPAPLSLAMAVTDCDLESRIVQVAGRDRAVHAVRVSGTYSLFSEEQAGEASSGRVSAVFRREGAVSPDMDMTLRARLLDGAAHALGKEVMAALAGEFGLQDREAQKDSPAGNDRAKYQDSPGKRLKPEKSGKE